MRTRFGSLEVLSGRGPASVRVEKIFFRFAGEDIVGNLVFFEPALVADPAATVSQIEFPGSTVTDGAGVILFAQRLQGGWQVRVRIDLAQQFVNRLFALRIATFAEVAEAQVAVFVEQVFGGPVAIRKSLPDFAIAVDHDGVG